MSDKRFKPQASGTTLPVPSPRVVGVRVGDQVYMPALPADGDTAAALRGSLNAHLKVVTLLDHIYAGAEAFAAGRTVIHDLTAEREAREESRAEVLHAREIAKNRRQREIHEAELDVLQAQHRYEAVRDFKAVKFDVGHARYRQRVASPSPIPIRPRTAAPTPYRTAITRAAAAAFPAATVTIAAGRKTEAGALPTPTPSIQHQLTGPIARARPLHQTDAVGE